MRRVASDEEQIAVITETFRLLGDPTRLRILLACLFAPQCVNAVRGARLVRAERVGRQIFYAAADDHVNGMLTEMVAHVRQADSTEDDGMDED